MSSRQEEKQRRREERQRREQAEADRLASGQRFRLVGVGLVVAVVIAVVVVLVVSGGGGDESGPSTTAASRPIPAQRITDFDAALRAGDCTARTYTSEGRTHLPSDTATNDKYKTNPPSSGDHRPTPAQDGVYSPGSEPARENAVHTLEHGRVEIQYRTGTPAARIAQLQALFDEPLKGVAGYHQLLYQNNTNMSGDIAVVAWTQVMRCGTFNDKVFDAIRAFRQRYVDKGPELIP